MRSASVLIILALVCIAAKAKDLVISKATVVIVFNIPANPSPDKEKQEMDEVLGDFRFYAQKFKNAAGRQKNFEVVTSSASQIRFRDESQQPVNSTDLHGLGFILYKPRMQPVIIEGVATDGDLVCEASKLFKVHIEGYRCDP